MKFNDIYFYTFNKNVFFDTPASWRTQAVNWVRRLGRSLERRLGLEYTPGFSEQMIEYALLFQNLPADARHVLDFGCVENVLPMMLCSLGYRVTGMDFRPYPFTHPNFTAIQGDVLTWEAPEAAFDVVISISTVEHVGLGYSGDPVENDGDRRAVEKLWRALRPGGLLYLTVPAGAPKIARGYRTYDRARLDALVPGDKTVRFFRKPHRTGAWEPVSDAATIDTLIYAGYEGLYPTEAVAVVIARKP